MPFQLLLPVIDTISILFMGDVMQHREQLMYAHINGEDTVSAQSYDYSSYFKHTRRLIEAADFAVANMEFALGGAPYTGYPAFSTPETLPQEALNAGIDLFLCANNHICDRGRKGLRNSLEQYREMGARITGIYADSLSEAEQNPYLTDIEGIRVAFINFTYGTNGIPVPPPYIVNRMDREKVSAAIERARERKADIIIALPHWGTEYTNEPSTRQKAWNEFLWDEGVHAVIGGHPHVVQPIRTRTAPDGSRQITLYSMGNFISNMSYGNTELGAVFLLRICKTSFGQAYILDGEAIPVWCARKDYLEDNYTVIPVREFLDRPELFRNRWNHTKMKNTYNRYKTLFENDQ